MNNKIKIKRLALKGVGPLDSFEMEPSDLNLIYGKNETGKTYIVEFMINSLLGKKNWDLRKTGKNGRTVLSGLPGGEKEFTPGSKNKLQKYMKKDMPGLPPDMEKLLFVKGGQTYLKKSSSGGIDPEGIKQLFSEREILDNIDSSIPSTFKDVKFEDGTIEVSRSTNDARDMYELEKEIKNLDRFINKLDEEYAAGPIVSIEKELEATKDKIKEFEKARRARAYEISENIEKLKKRKIDPDDYSSLNDKIIKYSSKEEELRKKNEKLKKQEKHAAGYGWLKEAEKLYSEKYLNRVSKRPEEIIAVSAAIIMTALVSALNISLIIKGVFAAVILSVYLILKNKNFFKDGSSSKELKKIKERYRDYFGSDLKSFPDLKEKLSEKEAYIQKTRDIKEEIEEQKSELSELKESIDKIFIKISESVPEPEKWGTESEAIKNSIKETEEKIANNENELARLNVDETDYISEKVSLSYDPSRLAELEEKKEKLNKEKNEKEKELNNLRRRLEQETGSIEGEGFNSLIQKLREKRNGKANRLKELRAKITGLSYLYEVVSDLKDKEEDKIKKNLNDSKVTSPLKDLTGRYEKLKLEGDRIILSDKYSDYDISQISTGAKEQILIALRLGIMEKIMGGRKMFFVFDDAFQHSDWERRQNLVRGLVEAAKGGWQIFYFTMDDHIRDLIKKEGEKLKEGFKYQEI